MTDALEGPRAKNVTLREQANAPRIGRARFIGNAIGAILLVLVIEVALTVAGFKETLKTSQGELSLPNQWVSLVGSGLIFLCLLDLAVRRRHDRDRSGIDVALILVVLEVLNVAVTLRLAPVSLYLGAGLTGIACLYLLVVLAILPGSKGPNRYGPDPRQA